MSDEHSFGLSFQPKMLDSYIKSQVMLISFMNPARKLPTTQNYMAAGCLLAIWGIISDGEKKFWV